MGKHITHYTLDSIPHFKQDNEAHVVLVTKCKSNEVSLCMQEHANTA